MSKNRNQNILLIEIIIAVLFFALCSVVMLETFVAARESERISGIEMAALIEMQNISEEMYAADDAESFISGRGFEYADGVWTFDAEEYVLEADINNEVTMAGKIVEFNIRALRNDEMIAELPGSRYMPGGDAE